MNRRLENEAMEAQKQKQFDQLGHEEYKTQHTPLADGVELKTKPESMANTSLSM